jgi:hypothetical protein
VRASSEPQPLYPRIGMVLRALYLAKRVLGHLRVMDLSITPGKTGYRLWRLGIVQRWQRWFVQRPPRPERVAAPAAITALRVQS